jgi:hypothetical protein
MDTNPSGTRRELHFTPTPIPEAKAFAWEQLLRPTRRGLRELLSWLEAACQSIMGEKQSGDEHLSTSLLISGPRGSGKTTILLSALRALRDPEAFLAARAVRGRDAGEAELAAERHELARTLSLIQKRVIWLEPLDLEPVPSQANLLATLLVRVRAALDTDSLRHDGRSRGERGGWTSSSILEESAEETWGKLDHLVRDASFMWEDIPTTTDARVRAEQQIKASEIYANFQQRFSEAMEDVARTLSMPRFGASSGEQVLLVLPIDNVDRSIEHLYNIVKLTRMVASRRLWFVLAAGHQEFQLFMERSFQKELISNGQAGIGAQGQEETLAIARRQAATTLRRALPPSYRINLGPVSPHRAWSFRPQGAGLGRPGEGGNREVAEDLDGRTLGELLERLSLPRDPKREKTWVLRSFADLFDLGRRLHGPVRDAYRQTLRDGEAPGEEAGPHDVLLTHAGRLALTLPARTLQDLWHAARRELMNPTVPGDGERADRPDDGERAAKVATEMLRNAIDESELPAWATEQLHNRILRLDDKGRIHLDLTGKPVCRSKRTTLSDVLEWPSEARAGNGHDGPAADGAGGVLISELHLRRFHEVVLILNDLEGTGRSVPLPANVAGWYMLLHDVLMLFEPSRVLNLDVTPFEMSPEMVVTLHEVWAGDARGERAVQLECWWSPPTWSTFIEFAIFTAQWKAFLRRRADVKVDNMTASRMEVGSHQRFIQAAWVENICSVSDVEMGRWDWGDKDSGVEAVVQGKQAADALKRYEQQVRGAVAGLIANIRAHSVGYDRLWTARVWLQNTLPLLVFPEFAPEAGLSDLLCWRTGSAGRNPDWEDLRAYWASRAPRLLRLRERVVRAAVERSTAAETLRQALEREGGPAADTYYAWLDAVVDAWFRAVDGQLEHLEVEFFRTMSPTASARAGAVHGP